MKKTIKKAQFGKFIRSAIKSGEKALFEDVEKKASKPLTEWQKKAGYTKTLNLSEQKAKRDLQKSIEKRNKPSWFDDNESYKKTGGAVKKKAVMKKPMMMAKSSPMGMMKKGGKMSKKK